MRPISQASPKAITLTITLAKTMEIRGMGKDPIQRIVRNSFSWLTSIGPIPTASKLGMRTKMAP